MEKVIVLKKAVVVFSFIKKLWYNAIAFHGKPLRYRFLQTIVC